MSHAENEAGRLGSKVFFFLKKKEALYEAEASVLQLSLNIFP